MVRSQNHRDIPPSVPKVFVLLSMVPPHCSTAYMDLLFDSHHVIEICVTNIFQDVLVSGLHFDTMKFDLQGWNVRLH